MKKLKLQVETLAVVSFPTAAAQEARGTVAAHATEEYVITPRCQVTSGVDSCWCTEYNSCGCTV